MKMERIERFNEAYANDDLIKCGINMGVSKRKCDAIISYIEDVAKRFSDYMEMAGVREKTCQMMNDIIIRNNKY